MAHQRVSRRAFLAGTAAAGLTAAAPRGRPVEAADPKVLKVRSYYQLEALDPAFQISASDGDIIDTILMSLVTTKPGETWGWERDAALSIEQVDPTHIRFQLRPGLGWTGGFGEVTAEDVKFSYERIANPAMKSPYRGDWAKLDRVQVTGTHTGVITLKEPFIPLWTTTLPTASSAIVCKKAVEKMDGQRFTMDPGAVCGPYRIRKWEPRQSITLERNPQWTGPAAPLRRDPGDRHRRRQRGGDRLRGRPDRRDPRADDLRAAPTGQAAGQLDAGGPARAHLLVARHAERGRASSRTSGSARRSSWRWTSRRSSTARSSAWRRGPTASSRPA